MTGAFDPLWEKVHSSRDWGSYPEEALIRFTARNYYRFDPRSSARFLDLGCGGGATTWYLAREGFNVDAIDGSKSAIASVRRRLERDHLSADLTIGDVTSLPYPDQTFDSVVEIGCLTCLRDTDAAKAIGEVRRVLKPGGRFLSFTPARGCWGDGVGREVGSGTFVDADEGPFAGLGLVRFASRDDVQRLYGSFSRVTIDRVDRTQNGGANTISQWSIVCEH